MNMETESRIHTSISTAELERRWKAVRAAMKEKGLDFLIVQNSTDILGGYVKWLTDVAPRINYPSTVIFPREEEMTSIWHGPRPPARPGPPSWAIRGVKKRIGVPIIPSLEFSSIFDAEKVVEELAPYGKCRIGLVGMGLISASFYKYVTEHLTAARFEKATDMVDEIKAIKSDEEIRHIRETCKLQDELFAYTLTRVEPGRRDYEIYADVMGKCLALGGQQANIMLGSFPYGKPAEILPPTYGNRMIQDGDQFTILLETNGPSGIWTELARTICLGRASPELVEQLELARQAQKVTLDLLKPGANPADIWEANNAFLRSIGYQEERRIYAHGMGYDMVERPSIDPLETMKIKAGMNMAVHPAVISAKANAWLCENYIVTKTGVKECLHKTPQKIFVK